MFHPAYPTPADLSRAADAEARDRADLATLHELRTIVSIALARASQVEPIRHPDRRWTTEGLLDALTDQLTCIDGTAMLLTRSTLVLED